MAKQSTETLRMLIDLADREVNKANEALAHAMKIAEDAQSKQNMLHEYRQAYIDNLSKTSATGIGADTYINYQNFFGKLDQAISGQIEVVAIAKRAVQSKRELWQEMQRKKLSYEVLKRRADKQSYNKEQKIDQKLMDEFSTRMSRTSR